MIDRFSGQTNSYDYVTHPHSEKLNFMSDSHLKPLSSVCSSQLWQLWIGMDKDPVLQLVWREMLSALP